MFILQLLLSWIFSQSIQNVGSVKVPIKAKNVDVPMLQGAIATRCRIVARCA